MLSTLRVASSRSLTATIITSRTITLASSFRPRTTNFCQQQQLRFLQQQGNNNNNNKAATGADSNKEATTTTTTEVATATTTEVAATAAAVGVKPTWISIQLSKIESKLVGFRLYRFFHFFFKRNWFRRLLRTARIAILAVIIYQAGYQGGIADYAQNPREFDRQLMIAAVRSTNATAVISPDSPNHRRVDHVTQRIIAAAHQHLGKQLLESVITEEDKQQMETRLDHLTKQWHCVVTNSPVPNAFVMDLLPRRIFVNLGLLQFCDDDELAVIMGHELSHFLHGHGQSRSDWQASVAAIQLILLSLVDPTGVMTFAVDVLLARVGEYVLCSHSRRHEEEADHTGLQIAALACYDTAHGAGVFGRLKEIAGEGGGWSSTHPAMSERDSYLREYSLLHNPDRHGHCDKTKDLKRNMLSRVFGLV